MIGWMRKATQEQRLVCGKYRNTTSFALYSFFPSPLLSAFHFAWAKSFLNTTPRITHNRGAVTGYKKPIYFYFLVFSIDPRRRLDSIGVSEWVSEQLPRNRLTIREGKFLHEFVSHVLTNQPTTISPIVSHSIPLIIRVYPPRRDVKVITVINFVI